MTTPLPPTDPSTPDAKLPGEAELAALYRQLPRTEPSPALDAAVLGAAAQALKDTEGQRRVERRKAPRERGDWVHPRPYSAIAARTIASVESADAASRRQLPRWLVGLGSAASLVLVAGLAWQMRQKPAPSVGTTVATDSVSAVQASAPAVPPNEPDAGQARRGALSSSAEAQVFAPMQSKSQSNHLPPATLPGLKPVAPGASATSAAPYTLSDKPIKQDNDAVANATRKAVLEKRAASAPKQPASAVESGAALPAPAMEVTPSAPLASPSDNRRLTTANSGDTPEQELAKIELLVRQHHEAEARRRLEAFQRAHPQWSLPSDLRGLLDEP